MSVRLARLFGWLRRLASSGTRRRGGRQARQHRVEQLEARLALSTVGGAPLGCNCACCTGAAYTFATGNNYDTGGFVWAQPGGRGSAVTITYSYSNLLDGRLGGGLSAGTVRAAIQEAFSRWAAAAPLHFVEVADNGPAPSDNDYSAAGRPMIRLGHRPIDGDYNVLAYGYYPGGTGLGGDIQFDTQESWSTHPASGMDLLEVATHEIGHALGLGHEPMPASGGHQAVMNPRYGGYFQGPGTAFLYQDDINGIRALYGSGTGSVRPLSGSAPSLSSPFRVVGTQLIVTGTGGKDTFQFSAGTTRHTVVLNGRTYVVDPTRIQTITFHGGAGFDSAQLTGGAAPDVLSASPLTGSLVGSNYSVSVLQTEAITLKGAGNDWAQLTGSAGTDTFTAAPTGSRMSGSNFLYIVDGVRHINAFGEGGHDVAYLYDTEGNDIFASNRASAVLAGMNYNMRANTFEKVLAYARGGTDYAYLTGTAGNDIYTATPGYAILSGSGFSWTVSRFEGVRAYGSGGQDQAYMYDSASNDRFTGGPTYAYLAGQTSFQAAHQFTRVYVYASTGQDVVTLNDSTGNDSFQASGRYGIFSTATTSITISSFDRVSLFGLRGGRNRTFLDHPSFTVDLEGSWG